VVDSSSSERRLVNFTNHAALTREFKIYVQTIELERSPIRVEIERELARVKNVPQRVIPRSETSPNS